MEGRERESKKKKKRKRFEMKKMKSFFCFVFLFLFLIEIELTANFRRMSNPILLEITFNGEAINEQISEEAMKTTEKELENRKIVPPKAIAPLLPLEPQFPLTLTSANRQLLIDNPEELQRAKEHIRDELKKHTFPWITLAILLIFGGMGWVAYLIRDEWLKRFLELFHRQIQNRFSE